MVSRVPRDLEAPYLPSVPELAGLSRKLHACPGVPEIMSQILQFDLRLLLQAQQKNRLYNMPSAYIQLMSVSVHCIMMCAE